MRRGNGFSLDILAKLYYLPLPQMHFLCFQNSLSSVCILVSHFCLPSTCFPFVSIAFDCSLPKGSTSVSNKILRFDWQSRITRWLSNSPYNPDPASTSSGVLITLFLSSCNMVCISALELHYVVIIMPCVKNCPFTWLTPSRLGVWGKSCCSSLVLGIFSTGLWHG